MTKCFRLTVMIVGAAGVKQVLNPLPERSHCREGRSEQGEHDPAVLAGRKESFSEGPEGRVASREATQVVRRVFSGEAHKLLFECSPVKPY